MPNTTYPTVGPVKSNGKCTVTFPSGATEEWTERTVRSRGYVPAAAPRQEFGVTGPNGYLVRDKVFVLAADLRKGDVVFLGADNPTAIATDPVVEGRNTVIRLAARKHRNGGFKRTLGSYQTILVAKS